jgi:hypothetical protein
VLMLCFVFKIEIAMNYVLCCVEKELECKEVQFAMGC